MEKKINTKLKFVTKIDAFDKHKFISSSWLWGKFTDATYFIA